MGQVVDRGGARDEHRRPAEGFAGLGCWVGHMFTGETKMKGILGGMVGAGVLALSAAAEAQAAQPAPAATTKPAYDQEAVLENDPLVNRPAPQVVAAPPQRGWHRRKGLMAGGIVVSGLGLLTIGAGASLVIASQFAETCDFFDPTCTNWPYRTNTSMRGGGIAMMIGGVALGAAGVPMIVLGARRVPDTALAPSALPAVALGPGTLRLDWAF